MKEFLLKYPIVYKLFQKINGAEKMRKIFSEEYIKSDKNSRILDLCCGTSDILPYLEFKEYIGVDLSDKYIKHNEKAYVKISNASFFVSDVNTYLKENKDKFDIVLLLGGMHHIDDSELSIMLKNIKEALPPHGKLVTLDGCYESHLTRFERLLLDKDRGMFVRTKEAWLDLFMNIYKDYKYSIRKNLYYLPYNIIIFYR